MPKRFRVCVWWASSFSPKSAKSAKSVDKSPPFLTPTGETPALHSRYRDCACSFISLFAFILTVKITSLEYGTGETPMPLTL